MWVCGSEYGKGEKLNSIHLYFSLMAALLSHGDKQGFQSVTLAEIYLGEFTGAFLDEKNKQFHHKVDERHAVLPEEMFSFSFFTSQHVQPEVNKS